jgi:glycogen operon protein
MDKWYGSEGSPHPLGVSFIPDENAFNFALYSKCASDVKLLLYDETDFVNPKFVFPLDPLVNKSQRVWHCRVKQSEIPGACFYGYRVDGHLGDDPSYWHRFDSNKILTDPYAHEVFFPPAFSRHHATTSGDNSGKAPLGCFVDVDEDFDWQGDQPVRHGHDLIIYEMHVRGFTFALQSQLPAGTPGTFSGVIEKIPYLKDLGITAVELMPVHQFDHQEDNYWGYMSMNFFAPNKKYAKDNTHGGPVREFKTMVRELHKAGIEVLLDVVFNHTTEGSDGGPCYSLKGIDNSSYYLLSHNPVQPYHNFSGTGNTLRTDHPVVQEMIVDSLRYWVKEMHVDGFRFDLASVFSRRSDGAVGESPIFSSISCDPDLSSIRLIAEPWDAGGLYQLGRSFPGLSWFQWNDGYRDDLRKFVKSDGGMVGSIMGRLYGSDNLFPGDTFHAFHPYQSVNYINSHDGFSLYDQLSFNNKRNHANGHSNNDGHEPNFSWNCGWEGDENVPADVMKLRFRQAKNFFTLLMLSNGTPMFLSGDEFLNTQKGNNNPYNQDNDTTWLNWDRLTGMQEHFIFVKKLITFRKQHPSLCRSRFWRDDVKWFGTQGNVDLSFESRSLAYFLDGQAEGDNDFYVMINAHWEQRTFTFMQNGPWKRVIDTQLDSPDEFLEPSGFQPIGANEYNLRGRSVAVFIN